MAFPVSGVSPLLKRAIAATDAEISGKLNAPSSLNKREGEDEEDAVVPVEEAEEIEGVKWFAFSLIVAGMPLPTVGEEGCLCF